MIGLVSVDLGLGRVGAPRRLLERGGLAVGRRRRPATPPAGSVVSPVSVTVPTSEVIDDQLVGDVRRVVGGDEQQLDLAAGLHVVGGLRRPQVDVAQRDVADVGDWCR